jgi:isochorismate synthase
MLADPLPDLVALDEARARAARLGRPILVSSTRSVAPFDPLALFDQARANDRALWLRPSSGEALVGLGAAQVVSIDVEDRFAAAGRAWSALLADAMIDDPAGVLWTGPVLLGGFRFDTERPPTELWSGFATDRLVLPSRLFVQRGRAAWLTTNRVVGPSGPIAQPQLALGAAQRGLRPGAWQTLVGAVARGIRRRELGLDKVVLARTQSVRGRAPFEPAHVARRLASAYPTCTIFGLGHGDACFVGATPERLVSVCAGLATTMALAGSIGRGQTDAEDLALGQSLLNDPKERSEHAFVVSALRAGLAEVSTRVIADAEPRLRKLANLQHLLTPVHGQLASGRSILDVVQHLHPTPAVGGAPTAPALDLIRARERLDRGWYAGPIGWINRAGEGEFVVGLRSALLRGADATLFAGCGIVANSDARAELAESIWKLRPMLSALGDPAVS